MYVIIIIIFINKIDFFSVNNMTFCFLVYYMNMLFIRKGFKMILHIYDTYVARIYIYIYNFLCGSVAKASDTQAVGHGFEPRPDH